MGKGRKERCTPLTKQAVDTVKVWLPEIPPASSVSVLSPGELLPSAPPSDRCDAIHLYLPGTTCGLHDLGVLAVSSELTPLNSKLVPGHAKRPPPCGFVQIGLSPLAAQQPSTWWRDASPLCSQRSASPVLGSSGRITRDSERGPSGAGADQYPETRLAPLIRLRQPTTMPAFSSARAMMVSC